MTDSSKLAALPATYHTLPAVAKEYNLACVQLPPDVSTWNSLFFNGFFLLGIKKKMFATLSLNEMYDDFVILGSE